MHLPTTNAQDNLDEFIEKYGEEGILILFFTNLLEEIIRGEFLHTKDTKIENSPGILEFQDNDKRLASIDILRKREKDLRIECQKRAQEIVSKLKQRGVISKFDHNLLQNEEVKHQINLQLRSILNEIFGVKWGDEV